MHTKRCIHIRFTKAFPWPTQRIPCVLMGMLGTFGYNFNVYLPLIAKRRPRFA